LCSQEYIAELESGEFSGLQKFLEKRERIIKALDLYDKKISEVIEKMSPTARDESLLEAIRACMVIKNDTVARIVKLDAKIMDKIENEMKSLVEELTGTRKNKDNLSKFKSTWVAKSGEELDKTL
jgi:triphosphoribosyl-dephospho-CoA synthetase